MLDKRLQLFLFIIVLGALLTGCLKGEQTFEEMDVPGTVMEENEEDIAEKADEAEEEKTQNPEENIEIVETEETILRELFLIDANGLVVPQSLELPKTQSAAMQSLEYLVKEGPVTELLPNGFQAVLPAGTEIIGVNLQEDGTLIVDVSEEFKNYGPNEELKILQAMTHTLTQFESVERIKLWINGVEQTEMPVNGTPISDGYSIKNGINIYAKDRPDLKHSKVVTIYYPKTYHDQFYYVPVTQYMNEQGTDIFTLIVEALMDGPDPQVEGIDVFNDETTLVNKPFLQNGVLQLEFNEAVLKDPEKAIIADDVMETLVRTLTSQDAVDAIEVKVENKDTIANESGKQYDKPVQKTDFTTSEKM